MKKKLMGIISIVAVAAVAGYSPRGGCAGGKCHRDCAEGWGVCGDGD